MRHSWKVSIAIASLAGCAMLSPAAATIVPIDTLPGPLDPTTTLSGIGASLGFVEYAVGFEVAQAGTVTHITTTLGLRPGSRTPLVIGIATSRMIGTPGPSLHRDALPPGSLWQGNVCSTTVLGAGGANVCTAYQDRLPAAGALYPVGDGQPIDLDVDIALPVAGTYWFYEWFPFTDIATSWIANAAEPTTLVAARSGLCLPPTNCMDTAALTFIRATQAMAAPGIRVEVEPAAVPEPAPIVLWAIGGLVGWRLRRRRAPERR